MSLRVPLLLSIAICVSAGSILAQDDKAKTSTSREKAAARKKRDAAKAARSKAGLSSSQQDTAMSFAQENLPELVPLLKSLQKTRRPDYNRALRELHSAAMRFGKMKERMQGDRYERQLSLWKLDWRIKLQVAKWSASPSDKLEADIRRSIAERRAIRQQQYELDLIQAKERVSKLENAIEKLNQSSADKEFEQLTRSAKRRRPQKKQPKRKADSKKSKSKQDKKPEDKKP